MIDVHSHAWQYPKHFEPSFREQAVRAWGSHGVDLTVRHDAYLDAARSIAGESLRTIVFGGKAKLSGVWVDDDYVAAYAAQQPDALIGFLSVDPTQPGWRQDLERGHQDLRLRGIKLLPMYAGFRPCDRSLDDLWSYASRHHLPVLLHTGTTFIAQAPLECTLPRHLDDVAIRFPDVRIVMAHLGHPYEGECIVTIRKHPNVYADVSAIHYRRWQLYNSLTLAQEYGVWGKLLFGTDYPFATVDDSLAGLRGLNAMLEGTSLPRLDPDEIERLIHRDSLALLGIAA
jgi:predicted TIM-barrel fold metal-dependent hydrolase